LDTVAEDHRVNKRITALEWVSVNTNTFWSNVRRRQAVVRLQDHAQHIKEVVQGCQRALTTMFLVILPRILFPKNFRQLLSTFRTSEHIHRLIRLNHLAGANFALAWIQKWKPQTDFETISRGFPPHRSKRVLMRAHVDATLEPAKRMISRVLEADASFVQEQHYLDPLLSGPMEQ
jgi:hypothetical protein